MQERKVQSVKGNIYRESDVDSAIEHLSHELNRFYQDGKVMVCPLITGAIVFTGKILTKLHFELTVEPVSFRRYSGSKGHSIMEEGILPDFRGKDVLFLDDILDEGITLQYAKDKALAGGANSVTTAVMLERQVERNVLLRPDFVALKLYSTAFVVGEGLDYNGIGRNIAGIWEVTE